MFIKEESLRAALYIRVSTDDQLEYSPDAQKNALIAYASKNNMTVAEEHVFIEEGKSGRTVTKRPKFNEMIGIAKTVPKPFDAILVHKFDRFARSREDSIVFKSMLKKDCGIKVVSITESINEDDKLSILIEALLEAMAEYYSINLAEEVKKGMTEKALQGGFQTSPPLGYYMVGGELIGGKEIDGKLVRAKLIGGKLTVHEEEAKWVQYIYDQFLNYNRSPFQIAGDLNELDVKSKRGNRMDGRGVEYILQNPFYIGKTHWTPTEKTDRNFAHPDKIIVQGKHTPIISEEIFNAVAEKFSKMKKKARPKQRPLEECGHWLSGLVKCKNCNSSLAVGNKQKYPSFQCTGYTHQRCDTSHSITIKKLEAAILKELSSVLDGIGEMSFELNVVRTDNTEDKIIIKEKQLAKIDDKFLRAKDAYLSGADSLEEYKATKKSLEEQKTSLISEIKSLKNNQPKITQEVITQRFGNLIDLLTSNCDLLSKQKAIRSVIQKIVYSKPDESLEFYYFDM